MDELKQYHIMWKKEKLLVGDLREGDDHQYLFHNGLMV